MDNDDYDLDDWELEEAYQLERQRKQNMTTDTRQNATYSQVEYFKLRVKAWHKNTSQSGKESAARDIENYLRRYKNLDQYDTRNGVKVAPANTSKNYIEIKQGGITFRKAGTQLTIICNETIDYTEANLASFNATIAAGLEVVAAASKFDLMNSTPPAGVSI